MKAHTSKISGAVGLGDPSRGTPAEARHENFVSSLAPNMKNGMGAWFTWFVAVVHILLWAAAIGIASYTIQHKVGDLKKQFDVDVLNATIAPIANNTFDGVFRALDNTVEFADYYIRVLVSLQASVLGLFFLFELIVWYIVYKEEENVPHQRGGYWPVTYSIMVFILSLAQCALASVTYTVMLLNLDDNEFFLSGIFISMILFFMTTFMYRYNMVWKFLDWDNEKAYFKGQPLTALQA